jgi:hypothetical protein
MYVCMYNSVAIGKRNEEETLSGSWFSTLGSLEAGGDGDSGRPGDADADLPRDCNTRMFLHFFYPLHSQQHIKQYISDFVPL